MSGNQVKSTSERPAAGEQAILAAAVDLFSEHGYDRVSMRAVAAAAGVSKSNIYHHFRSKEMLYVAILQASARNLSVLVEGLAGGHEDFVERLEAFAAAHLQHLFDNRTTMRLALREAFSGDASKQQLMADRVVGDIFKRLIDIFKAGQEAGIIRTGLDPAVCALLLIGSNLFYFQARGFLELLPGAEPICDPGRYSVAMSRVLLDGMLNDPRGGVRP